MESLLVLVSWVLFGCAIIQLEGYGSLRCMQQERVGLLKLKEAFNSSNVAASAFFSWGGKDRGWCRWENVKCDFITKRVVQLSLNSTKYDKQTLLATKIVDRWYLDFSLFLPFQELQNLSLADNFLLGWFSVYFEKGFSLLVFQFFIFFALCYFLN
ncbi:hypothetical protein Pfo_000548 [Paulownia fortunei]|nr:hypothetical protein Pfo_000548 [Paulownia fortunei]